MELREIHILDHTLNGLLTESEKNSLKRKFVSETEYNKYLLALLEVVIRKKNKTTLKELLSLLAISHIQNDLQKKTTDFIEELAELHFKGYQSEYTQWLKDHKNEIFVKHLVLLKETKTGVTNTERENLKSKLVNIDKLEAFEFDEKDIQLGIKLNERTRLKKHFNELYSELNAESNTSPKTRKFALAFTIVLASSIIFSDTCGSHAPSRLRRPPSVSQATSGADVR